VRSVELFAGAGGLALGVEQAGFQPCAVIEWDNDACHTLHENARRHVRGMDQWPIFQTDVRLFNYGAVPKAIDLVAAGVPCQPFSIGGKHRGHLDERNMFPELVRAIRELRPKAVLVENVRGLARPSFAKYFGYIELMLMYPEIQRKGGEEWLEHLSRLERYHTRGKREGLWYRVIHRVLNAADFGIPQKRERLFMVAIRADLGIEWSFPAPTHSLDALFWDQFCTGAYWERHGVGRKRQPRPSQQTRSRIVTLQRSLPLSDIKPWKTIRDAFLGLDVPRSRRTSEEPGLTHFIIPGARSYVGHTGSLLDEPSKTLKAGVHGVPGGENTLVSDDGDIRYFTIRESARLQTFPDSFVFCGSWTESMRQIGNAVPVRLAEIVARRLMATLSGEANSENGRTSVQSPRQTKPC
jgi:DNA (cytosine-5)-methyltransferase 1